MHNRLSNEALSSLTKPTCAIENSPEVSVYHAEYSLSHVFEKLCSFVVSCSQFAMTANCAKTITVMHLKQFFEARACKAHCLSAIDADPLCEIGVKVAVN